MNSLKPQIAEHSEDWVELARQEAWNKAQSILNQKQQADSYAKYRDDPIKFGMELLGEHYTDDAIAVANSVRDNVITVARSATDVGKSHIAARIAMWFFVCFDDSKVYMTAAPPLENLKQILWGELMQITRKRPSLIAGFRRRTLTINRHWQSFVTGVAIPITGSEAEREAKFSGKHAPKLLFIVDEGDAVPDEVYRGIEGCMSSGGDEVAGADIHASDMIRLLVMFNPRAKIGPVWRMEYNGQANVVQLSALDHPNVLEGTNVIPGCVSRATTVRRINKWTRPLAVGEEVREDSPDVFEVPNFLIGETAKSESGRLYPPLTEGKRIITDPSFSYMVLGEYPAQAEQQLISQEWVDKARIRHDTWVAKYGEMPPAGVQPVMGLDVAEFGPDPNVACFRYGSFITFQTWNGLDPDASSLKALELYKEKNVSTAMVDATGVGSGIAPAMARRARERKKQGLPAYQGRNVRAVGVKVSDAPGRWLTIEQGEFFQLRDQLWWAVRNWLEQDDTAMLPNNRLLLEDLTSITYSKTNRGKIKIDAKDQLRKILSRSTDYGDALALTFYPFHKPKWVHAVDISKNEVMP